MRNIKHPRFKKFTTRYLRKFSDIQIEQSITVDECIKTYNKKIGELFKDYETLYGKLIVSDTTKRRVEDEYDVDGICEFLKKQFRKPSLTREDIIKLLEISDERKNLSIDKYLPEIYRIFNQFKVIKRTYDKPMMTTKGQVLLPILRKIGSESHLTMRGMHQEQVADLSAEIAKDLGLNVGMARIMGRHHDDGHSNGGHTGERIATFIGMLNNCGYIVHNALSADMLLQENAIKRVLKLVRKKEGELSPERIKEIKENLWYILDGPISHNGEGNERIIKYNPDKTVEEIKRDKNQCYTKKGYDKSIMPGTKESALVAFVDRICYVRTDILDGVNLGILTEYNDDYLKYIGILATKHDGKAKEFEMYTKIFKREEELDKEIENYVHILEGNGIEFGQETSKEEILEFLLEKKEIDYKTFKDKIDEYRKIKELSKNALEAAKEYGRKFVSDIPIANRAETVADMIKDVVADDLKEYSKEEQFIGISPAIAKAFFGIRSENLKQIVKFTRRKYERELLPKAELKIFEDLKSSLISTGIMAEYIAEKEGDNEHDITDIQKQKRKLYGISGHIQFRKSNDSDDSKQKRYTGTRYINTKIKNLSIFNKKYRFERKICHHFMKLYERTPERIEEIYQNAIDAVDDITEGDVLAALNIKGINTDILTEEYEKKINAIRADIKKKYPNGIKENEIKEYIESLSLERKNDKEGLLASAIALEYVAGMTDSTLLEAARLKKYLGYLKILRGYSRGAKPEEALDKMGKFWNGPEEKKEQLSRMFDDEER